MSQIQCFFFWQFVAKHSFLFVTTYLPKNWKKNLKVLPQLPTTTWKGFWILPNYNPYFEYCKILAKYSLWMIITQANSSQNWKQKHYLCYVFAKQATNPIVAMRVQFSTILAKYPLIVFSFFGYWHLFANDFVNNIQNIYSRYFIIVLVIKNFS